MINKENTKLFFKKNLEYIALAVLLLAGFVLRIYKIDVASLWIDEGFTIMQIRAILSHGYPLLDSGSLEIKDLLVPYLSAGLMKIFNIPIFSLRLIPVFFGTFSIYLAYILGRKLFNKKVSLAFSFFLAFSYWHIAWSRQIRGYALLVFFVLLFIICLVYYKEEKRNKYLILSLLAIVGASISKSFGILLFPFFILFLFLEKKYIFSLMMLAFFIFFNIIFSHLLINAFNISFVNYLGQYSIGYLWNYFGIVTSAFIVGIYFAIKNNEHNCRGIHILILALFFAVIAFFSFFVYLSQKRYLFFITPFIFLYASYLLYCLSKISKKLWVFFCIILAIIFLDHYTVQTFVFYPKDFYALEHYTPQPNFNLAYDFIKKEMASEDTVVSAYPFMDLIYLNKSDYAIPISYTGREEDMNTSGLNEYYSGTKKLYGVSRGKNAVDKLEELRLLGNVYVISDSMALSKMELEIKDYIIDNYDEIFQSNDIVEQRIYVHKLSKKT